MLPDDQPPTHPFDTPACVAACTQCGEALNGNRWRCPSCLAATYRAIELAGGETVTPSMIDRERERDVDAAAQLHHDDRR
jgi:hypothetical protein